MVRGYSFYHLLERFCTFLLFLFPRTLSSTFSHLSSRISRLLFLSSQYLFLPIHPGVYRSGSKYPLTYSICNSSISALPFGVSPPTKRLWAKRSNGNILFLKSSSNNLAPNPRASPGVTFLFLTPSCSRSPESPFLVHLAPGYTKHFPCFLLFLSPFSFSHPPFVKY